MLPYQLSRDVSPKLIFFVTEPYALVWFQLFCCGELSPFLLRFAILVQRVESIFLFSNETVPNPQANSRAQLLSFQALFFDSDICSIHLDCSWYRQSHVPSFGFTGSNCLSHFLAQFSSFSVSYKEGSRPLCHKKLIFCIVACGFDNFYTSFQRRFNSQRT